MRTILTRAIVFSVGVFAFWLLDALRLLVGLRPGAPHDAMMFEVLRIAGTVTIPSGIGALLGLAAARRATPSVPVWLIAAAGVLFGFLTEPALDVLHTAGFAIHEKQLGSLLTVAMVAAVFAWLGARSVQLLRRHCHFIEIRNEYHRISSDKPEMISLLLAASPWLLSITQLLGTPGFG